MNSLILTLAPFGGLASALPAMAAADRSPVRAHAPRLQTEAPTFAPHREREAPGHDGAGGYLLL